MSKKQRSPARTAIQKIAADRDESVLAHAKHVAEAKKNWIDPRVDPQPIQPQGPTQTYRGFAETVIEKMAESLGVLSPLLDPIPREDEARPCSLCESRRPAGKSYSRVYCTKQQVRYCKCHFCGHTWSQERK